MAQCLICVRKPPHRALASKQFQELLLLAPSREQPRIPAYRKRRNCMAKSALRIAALGVSVLGSRVAIAQNMTLTSSDLKEGDTIVNEQVFKGFGCAGGNVSPALSWRGAPSGTKSFAVSIYDPDAPTGGGWWHWV